MSESASSREPAIAAAEAVKAYVRMNRARLSADGELLALLMPDRFAQLGVSDLQQHVIERLRVENQALRAECDLLKAGQGRGVGLKEDARRALLDLIDARCFGEVIAVAVHAAPAFGADRAAICVEGLDSLVTTASQDVRLIAPGTVAAVVGPEGMGAILSGGGELLLGCPGYRSLAAFRLRIGRDSPPALYVLGAAAEGRFDGADSETDLAFFTRALERAIRAWLDLPKA